MSYKTNPITLQIMETINIDGKKHYMATEPFGQYLEITKEVTTFSAPNTGYWRGYKVPFPPLTI